VPVLVAFGLGLSNLSLRFPKVRSSCCCQRLGRAVFVAPGTSVLDPFPVRSGRFFCQVGPGIVVPDQDPDLTFSTRICIIFRIFLAQLTEGTGALHPLALHQPPSAGVTSPSPPLAYSKTIERFVYLSTYRPSPLLSELNCLLKVVLD
jgi:hypothetical protein